MDYGKFSKSLRHRFADMFKCIFPMFRLCGITRLSKLLFCEYSYI